MMKQTMILFFPAAGADVQHTYSILKKFISTMRLPHYGLCNWQHGKKVHLYYATATLWSVQLARKGHNVDSSGGIVVRLAMG